MSLTQEAQDQWDQVVPRVAQALGALPLGGAEQLPLDTQSTRAAQGPLDSLQAGAVQAALG